MLNQTTSRIAVLLFGTAAVALAIPAQAEWGAMAQSFGVYGSLSMRAA